MLMAMLLQRHINLIDDSDHVRFDDPRVAQTIAFYAQLVAGPGRIGGDISNAAGYGTQDLISGDVCALFTPDWRAGYVKTYAPELAGQLRMMPLPKFDPQDAPTSTSGGTMIGIPRACKNPDLAWKLIKLLYLTPQSNTARVANGSGILPAVKSLWKDDVYHQADPYYGGQKAFELYIDLAEKIPSRIVTPYTTQGAIALALVLHRAENYLNSNGTNGLENACTEWLRDAQSQLQRRIDFGKFEP
jgi:ABC-type glycerol-3-phosphate transport system substrate-binding protein